MRFIIGLDLGLARMRPGVLANDLAEAGQRRRPFDRRQRQPSSMPRRARAGLRAPLAVRFGNVAKQFAVEPLIAAIAGDIILGGSVGQIQERADLGLDRVARPKRLERFGAGGAGAQIVDRAGLAEPAAEDLHVADQRRRRRPLRRWRSGRRACAEPAPARRGLRSAGTRDDPRFGRKGGEQACAKLWMVWILRPPGQSSTLANSCRARSRVLGSVASPMRSRSVANSLSLSRTHFARREPIRLDISAAAALVKVRHRIDSGGAPAAASGARARSRPASCQCPPKPKRGVDVRVRGERLLVFQGGKWLETRAHAASQAR